MSKNDEKHHFSFHFGSFVKTCDYAKENVQNKTLDKLDLGLKINKVGSN